MTTLHTVRRLEQLLQVNEEFYWALATMNKGLAVSGNALFHAEGLIQHYPRLREHLLSLKSMDDFDFESFRVSEHVEERARYAIQGLYPMLLAQWCVNSRRVYHIDRDLQALLMSTALDGLKWSDIQFPFNSFAISLAQPIGAGDSECDCVLLSPMDTRLLGTNVLPNVSDVYCLTQFSTRLEHWKPWNLRAQTDRRAVKDPEGAGRLVKKKHVAIRNANYAEAILIHCGNNLVLRTIDVLRDDLGKTSMAHLLWRIVAGLCVYRKMRHVESYVSDWKRIVRTKLPHSAPSVNNIITDGSEICVVRSRKQLSDVDRKLLFGIAMGKLAGYELECHFREGHYRRPPGKGHDPDFPQTVIVDPTIVRPDKWPTDGLPMGLEKVLAAY